jgi:hypothetical protein
LEKTRNLKQTQTSFIRGYEKISIRCTIFLNYVKDSDFQRNYKIKIALKNICLGYERGVADYRIYALKDMRGKETRTLERNPSRASL